MEVLLTIGGTDPSGGAGVTADLRTFAAHGVWGVSVVTAVVAQNTQRVTSWRSVDRALLHDQLLAVRDDFEISGVKVGMLGSKTTADVVARFLREFHASFPTVPIIVDPIQYDGTGETLLSEDVSLYELFQIATLITPNGPEFDAYEFPRGAPLLKKAGHFLSDETTELIDRLIVDGETLELEAKPRLDVDARGTGCHLSSAITAELAKGKPLRDAVEDARTALHHALRRAEKIGRGRPVLDHA